MGSSDKTGAFSRAVLLLVLAFTLSVFLSLALGVARVIASRRSLGAAAMVSSMAGLPFGVVVLGEALHRPGALVFAVMAGVLIGVPSLAVLSLVAPSSSRLRLIAAGLVPMLTLLAAVGLRHNPWSRFDVCLAEDTPGATDRFRTFTPVSCRSGVPLAQPIGADHAIIRFEDLDDDGADELLVMESEASCAWSAAYCPEAQTIQPFKLVPSTPPRLQPLGDRPGARLR